MSSGNTDSIPISLFSMGCIKLILLACSACLCMREEVLPYKSSPNSGCPMYAKCTRIWWVLPVSSLHVTREYGSFCR